MTWQLYPDIITAAKNPGDTPYYTNSSHLPVGYTNDIFEALAIQDDLQTLYTSGTVFHAFLGEKLPDWKAAANLVRKIAENFKLPYYTMSPTYSICPDHGYLSGEHFTCPKCGKTCEVWSRITGYYRPVQNWNDGKVQEFKDRQEYQVENSRLEGRRLCDRECCDGARSRHRAQHTGGVGRGRPVPLHHQDLPQLQHRQAGAGEGGHRLSGDGRERASGAGGPVRYPAGPHPDRPPRRAGGEAGERLHHQKIRHFAERVNNEKGGTLVPPFPSSKMPSLRSSTRGTAVTMRGTAKSPLSSVSHQRGTSMDQYFDIIIVGGGPAGLTAAVYARRAGKSVLLLERESFGGQIASSPKVENFPGLPAVSGAELAERLYSQAEALGTRIELEEALEIQSGTPSRVVTDYGAYTAGAVILAAGMRRRTLGLAGEDRLAGISFCAVCDGAFYAGQDVAVAGGGSTALQDALYLADICRHVTVIHRRSDFRADPILVERAEKTANLTLLRSTVVEALEGSERLTGLTLRNTAVGEVSHLPVSALFQAVGLLPESRLARSLGVPVDEAGFIAAGEDCLTPIPGIFAAGDLRAKEVRQLTTACADGAVAALAACRFCV